MFLTLALLIAPAASSLETPAHSRGEHIPALIEQLAEAADDPGGFSINWLQGYAFPPLTGREEGFGNPEPASPQETIRQLVQYGLAALPHLLAHLEDGRPTSIELVDTFGPVLLAEECDRNTKTDKPCTTGGGRKVRSHIVTVGDLCFAAIGHVVNRHYVAARLSAEPQVANIIVYSPARSPALAKQVRDAWGSMTREKHRASLIADFLNPDHAARLSGACQRLAYYYPDALEPLVLAFLARPTYSSEAALQFVQEKLYQEADAKKCRALFDAFLSQHGEPYRDGIQQVLFSDLAQTEEKEGLLPPPSIHLFNGVVVSPHSFGEQPGRMLGVLYGKPAGIKSKDCPPQSALSEYSKVALIENGLLENENEKIDCAVRDLLAFCKDRSLGLACMRRLVGRGYDADIEAYLRRGRPGEFWVRWARERFGWTRLHVAISRGHLETASRFISRGEYVDTPARGGTTPLHLAANGGWLDLVRQLVDAGTSLERKDATGLTPAQVAAQHDRLEVVQLLARRGCALPDLLTAAAAGKVTKSLLADRQVIKQHTLGHQTPLHLAACSGSVESVKLLLAHGMPVDAKDWHKRTALEAAAGCGHAAVVQELIRAKADIGPGSTGCYALYPAARNGHIAVARVLLDAMAAKEQAAAASLSLHAAVTAGHAAMVELLLERGAQPDEASRGFTALHLAVHHRQLQIAKLLLRAGATLGATDGLGRTPLHLAVAQQRRPLIELLLESGADVLAKDEAGETPLDVARREKSDDLVRLLEHWPTKP
jgi:ankyrin repeat protein